MNKEEMINHYGEKVVSEAESLYETDFDKSFWDDLSHDERHDYITAVRMSTTPKQVNTYFVAKRTKLPTSEVVNCVAFTGNCSTWGTDEEANEYASNEANRIANDVGGVVTMLGEDDLKRFTGIRYDQSTLRVLLVEKQDEPVAMIVASK